MAFVEDRWTVKRPVGAAGCVGRGTGRAHGGGRCGSTTTGPGTGPIFHTARAAVITAAVAAGIWRRAGDQIGLPGGEGWHELWHYHASALIAGGASPVAVARRLGRKDPTETLRTYAHLWPDDDDRMRDATDGLVTLTKRLRAVS